MVIAAFMRDESCGQCVPCRVGTVRQEEARRAAAVRPHARQRAGRDRADRRDRPGDARRLDLRPGPDRLVRDRVRHRATGSLHDMTQRTVSLTIDDQPVEVPEGSTILEACEKLGIDTPTLCYGETLQPANVVPRVRGRDRGRARPGAGVLAQGRGRHGGQDRLRARAPQPQDGHGVPRRPRSTCRPRRSPQELHRALRRRPRALRAAGAAGHRSATGARTGHHEEPDGQTAATVHRRSRSTTTSTCATTPSASSVTSASTPAAISGRTPSPSPSPGAASTRGSRPSTPTRCPTRRACTAATASPCARQAR